MPILGWLIEHVAAKPNFDDDAAAAGGCGAAADAAGVASSGRIMTYEEWLWKGICLALLLGAIGYLKSNFHQVI